MNYLSEQQKRKLIDEKLLTIEQLRDYAENAFKIMGNHDIRFPVLAIIVKDDYSDHYRCHIRQAVWKQCACKSSVYADQPPVIEIADTSLGELTLGFLTIDTPWEEIKSILEDLEVEAPCNF